MEGDTFAVGGFLESPLYGNAGLMSHIFCDFLTEDADLEVELRVYACMEQVVPVMQVYGNWLFSLALG